MSRIDDLIAEYCPDGVKHQTLGEIGEFIRGNGIQKRDFQDSGFGCIHYGQIYTYYGLFADHTKSFIDPNLAEKRKKAYKGDLVIATTSENEEDVCKACAWLGEEPIAISGDAYIFRHHQNPKYISYWAFRCLVWVSGSGGGGAGRVVWGYGYHVVVHRRPATA